MMHDIIVVVSKAEKTNTARNSKKHLEKRSRGAKINSKQIENKPAAQHKCTRNIKVPSSSVVSVEISLVE
jgi:hypothetical protein